MRMLRRRRGNIKKHKKVLPVKKVKAAKEKVVEVKARRGRPPKSAADKKAAASAGKPVQVAKDLVSFTPVVLDDGFLRTVFIQHCPRPDSEMTKTEFMQAIRRIIEQKFSDNGFVVSDVFLQRKYGDAIDDGNFEMDVDLFADTARGIVGELS